MIQGTPYIMLRLSFCLFISALLPRILVAQTGYCAAITCSGHGQCVETESGPVCACAVGYIPDHTELNCIPNNSDLGETSPDEMQPAPPIVAPAPTSPETPLFAAPTSSETAQASTEPASTKAFEASTQTVIVSPSEASPPSTDTTPKNPATPSDEASKAATASIDSHIQKKAQGGLVTGFVFDILGYGLFLAGGAFTSQNLALGLALADVGGLSMTIGAVIGTTSMTIRHRAFVNAGTHPNTKRKAGSWVLTSLTLAFFGAGIGLGVAAEDIGMGIASICMNATAVILETVNFLSTRKKWNEALTASVSSGRLQKVRIVPYAATTSNAYYAKQIPVFGISGLF